MKHTDDKHRDLEPSIEVNLNAAAKPRPPTPQRRAAKRGDAVENQVSQAEANQFRRSRSKTKDKYMVKDELRHGKVKESKERTEKKKQERSRPDPPQEDSRLHRERSSRDSKEVHNNKKTKKISRRTKYLESAPSFYISEKERCGCNEEVNRHILCNGDVDEAEVGCRYIKLDLMEMGKELLRYGPAVMVKWI